jgi:hypothetical protein
MLLAAAFALAALAVTCTAVALGSPYSRPKWSDIMINKAHHSWTTCPGPALAGGGTTWRAR